MSRLSRPVLVVDGIVLSLLGASALVSDLMSQFSGTGPLGELLHGPRAAGAVEAHLMLVVLAGALLVARPTRFLHGFAVVNHVVLLGIDLGYQDLSRQMGVHQFLPVLVGAHVLLMAGHVVSAVQFGRHPSRVEDEPQQAVQQVG